MADASNGGNESYPEGWWHATIHLNPATGEMHSDGDHRVRYWLEDQMWQPTQKPRWSRIKEFFGV